MCIGGRARSGGSAFHDPSYVLDLVRWLPDRRLSGPDSKKVDPPVSTLINPPLRRAARAFRESLDHGLDLSIGLGGRSGVGRSARVACCRDVKAVPGHRSGRHHDSCARCIASCEIR